VAGGKSQAGNRQRISDPSGDTADTSASIFQASPNVKSFRWIKQNPTHPTAASDARYLISGGVPVSQAVLVWLCGARKRSASASTTEGGGPFFKRVWMTLVKVAKAAPTSHARATFHFLGQHLPGNAALQDEQDAGQRLAVAQGLSTRVTPSPGLGRQQGLNQFP